MPKEESFKGEIKWLIYQVKIIMLAFYPLMLNTAKRSRTTVEALELKGYRYAATNRAVKRIKLAKETGFSFYRVFSHLCFNLFDCTLYNGRCMINIDFIPMGSSQRRCHF